MWRLVVEILGLALPKGAEMKRGKDTSSSRRKGFLRDIRYTSTLDIGSL